MITHKTMIEISHDLVTSTKMPSGPENRSVRVTTTEFICTLHIEWAH